MRYRDKGPESPKRAGDRRTLDAVEVRGRRRRADPDVSRAIGYLTDLARATERTRPVDLGPVIWLDADSIGPRVTIAAADRAREIAGPNAEQVNRMASAPHPTT